MIITGGRKIGTGAGTMPCVKGAPPHIMVTVWPRSCGARSICGCAVIGQSKEMQKNAGSPCIALNCHEIGIPSNCPIYLFVGGCRT